MALWPLLKHTGTEVAERVIDGISNDDSRDPVPFLLIIILSQSYIYILQTLLSKVTYKGKDNQATSNRDLV